MIILLLLLQSVFGNYEIKGYGNSYLKSYSFDIFISTNDIVATVNGNLPTGLGGCAELIARGLEVYENGKAYNYSIFFEGCTILFMVQFIPSYPMFSVYVLNIEDIKNGFRFVLNTDGVHYPVNFVEFYDDSERIKSLVKEVKDGSEFYTYQDNKGHLVFIEFTKK